MRHEAQARRPRSLITALVLIALGLVYLAQNLSGQHLGPLWTVIFFIPALGSLGRAWQAVQQDGAFTPRAAAFTLGGTAVLLLGLTFLLGWPWPVVGPLFLILLGLSALTGVRSGKGERR
ncbi:hypothetical protein Dgeo_2489 (plasmid) [Deinococcus geothermalis DSM 11300]|uniref:Uncharacterized protein n=1 Tax=Deinococcus geothermalis (strain DSM 11300 / CIP 105573 / AG-3a) TaxID=319795 RepID=Q1J3L1_DEIGD|nr:MULTISPECIES: hypothetical protein [Deinococcus]ABF43923.1 hypothetical protein Dgeo_2489 [Deinococcus geothermalis DSM 11300]MBI0446029.1 hypothetical protein [Deinococcus sp. DB0503]